MPMPSSSIACEIMYLVAASAASNPVCVKDLFLTLGYSEARVSEVLRSLIKDGWIEQRDSGTDKRKRFLYPTVKTSSLFGPGVCLELSLSVSKDRTPKKQHFDRK